MVNMPPNDHGPAVNQTLVRALITEQFPQWAHLPVREVVRAGWDNKTFHLGPHMVVRMPRAEPYAEQVIKEQRWLPLLAPLLPLRIPRLLALGEPACEYRWNWSVRRWLKGNDAASAHITDPVRFARSLARFLCTLREIDIKGGPLPGPHSFYRGGPLATYELQTRQAFASLEGRFNACAAADLWDNALKSRWQGSPVWVHGDISAGNLLVDKGRLSGVIDFGQLAVGDPACDFSIAWTFFTGESRKTFRARLGVDSATWARARAWTLWKALIVAADLAATNAIESLQPWRVIDEVLADYEMDR